MLKRSRLRGLVVFVGILVFAVIGYLVLNNSKAATNADIDNNGSVGISDLTILAANYGLSGKTFSQGDITGDGTVNIYDFSILAAQWGQTSGGSSYGPASPTPICDTSYTQSPYSSIPTATAVQTLINQKFPSASFPLPTNVVDVPAGDNSSTFGQNWQFSANTIYYFEPGVHYGVGAEGKTGDVFIGGYSSTLGQAIIDGANPDGTTFKTDNSVFIANTQPKVAVMFLTVADYNPNDPQTAVAGAVSPADHWYFYGDTIQHNNAAGIGLQNNWFVSYSCLRYNGREGFKSVGVGGPGQGTVVMDHVEIAKNNVCDADHFSSGNPVPTTIRPAGIVWATHQSSNNTGPTCQNTQSSGETGAGKWWGADGITVTNSYIHDNWGVGLWADTDDNGGYIANNYISDNWSSGLMWEISYNLKVEHNTFLRNGVGQGSTADGVGGNMVGAIYISQSGGYSAAPNVLGITQDLIQYNTFTDNWGGVSIYESIDRFCGGGNNNTSTANCTLTSSAADTPDGPWGWTITSQPKACDTNFTYIFSRPNIDDCRWKSQNNIVQNNQFNLNAAGVISSPMYDGVHPCNGFNSSAFCGVNGLFVGSSSQGPYLGSGNPSTQYVVPVRVTQNQGNVFRNNTYTHTGTINWGFLYYGQSGHLPSTSWQACPVSSSLACQDSGSTFQQFILLFKGC